MMPSFESFFVYSVKSKVALGDKGDAVTYRLDVNGKTCRVDIYREDSELFVKDLLVECTYCHEDNLPKLLNEYRYPSYAPKFFRAKKDSESKLSFSELIESIAKEKDPAYLDEDQWSELLRDFEVDPDKQVEFLQYVWNRADDFGWGSKMRMLHVASNFQLEYTNVFHHPNYDDLFICVVVGSEEDDECVDENPEFQLHKLMDSDFLECEICIGGHHYPTWDR